MANEEKDNAIWRYVNHKYVRSIAKNGDIYYTDEFYSEMYHKMADEHMSAMKAYAALGFNTEMLSESRAASAGTRAFQRMEKKEPFVNNPADYDSGTTFEEMIMRFSKGNMDKDDLYANMAARLIYLEEMQKALKKTISKCKVDRK